MDEIAFGTPAPVTTRLSLRGITRAQWLTLLGAWALWALDAIDFLLLTFVLIDIARTFHVALATASLLILATFGVRWLGGMMFGNLSDRIGRKVPMLIALAWFTAGAALTGIAWSFAAVFAFRLLLGFGMAPILTLGSTLIAESWPERQRAIGIGLLDTGWGFGSIGAAALYGLIYPHYGWRPLFFAGIAPGLLVGLFIWRFVPESPVSLRARAATRPRRMPAAVLLGEHGKLVFLLGVVQFLLQFGSWPLQGLLATLLRQHGFAATAVSLVTGAAALGQIGGFFASGFIAEAIGRRRAIALMLGIGCICVLLLTRVALGAPPLTAVFAFASGFFIVGASGIYPTILAENLPSDVRATGVGLIYNIGVIGGGVAPFVVLSSLRAFGVELPTGMFLYTLAGDVLGVAIILAFLRETRGVSIDQAGH